MVLNGIPLIVNKGDAFLLNPMIGASNTKLKEKYNIDIKTLGEKKICKK